MKEYDVVIFGGGTSGCACAYIAGILGLKTLVIEKKIHLGGSITSSLVVPAMQTSENQINTDFFKSLVSELKLLNAQVTYMDNEGWFNPELTKLALDRLLKKANVDILFMCDNYRIEYKNDKFLIKILSDYIEAKYIVDATANANIAQILNCEFLDEKYQPVSLRFQMSGVDIERFSNWLLEFDKDRTVTTVEKINGEIHLSTACTNSGKWALQPLFNDAVKKGILENNDCNYFQIFTVAKMPDTINFNAPRVLSNPEINPNDTHDVSKALVEAREAIYRLSNFCKKYLTGFETAYISNIADDLGIRVSRRVKGKYIYTVEDLKSGKTFKNPVLIGNYPIDVHSSTKDEQKLEKVMMDYQLPIEALISDKYDNLFVIGRCLSADFEAQAALRIQRACFSMGEGVAKYIKKLTNQRG